MISPLFLHIVMISSKLLAVITGLSSHAGHDQLCKMTNDTVLGNEIRRQFNV